MLNHIANEVKINAPPNRIKEILNAIKSDEHGLGSIDFNKIIPMPEDLNIKSESLADTAMEIYQTMQENGITYKGDGHFAIADANALNMTIAYFLEKYGEKIIADPALIDYGKECYENTSKFGAPTWYEWCAKNWGTKENAFGYEYHPAYKEGSDTIIFDTAWDGVPNILTKLSQRFPDAVLHYRWADEDIGQNTGKIDFSGGTAISAYCPERGSIEAMSLASSIMKDTTVTPESHHAEELNIFQGISQ